MRTWDDVITEQDRLVYNDAGYGGRIGFGEKPAFVIIDVNYNFVGNKPESISKSIRQFPYSCGEEGWKAVHQIASLLSLVRAKNIPIIYTTADMGPKPPGWLPGKSSRVKEVYKDLKNNEIVREIAPAEKDIVIHKSRASMFFGTPLLSILNGLKLDTLLVCGCTTSGCVRASVTEAFANNFRVMVIEGCTFDRGQMSHKINLFDMDAKYADVVSIGEVIEYLQRLQPY